MDKDRVLGSAKQIKGTVKEVVGKAVGDAKLESDGKAEFPVAVERRLRMIESRCRKPAATFKPTSHETTLSVFRRAMDPRIGVPALN